MMRAKFIIITITCILISAMFVGCGGSSAPLGIGDVVSGDIWQVKVLSVTTETHLEAQPDIPDMPSSMLDDDRSWDATEGYAFLIVGLQYSNISAVDQELATYDYALTDSEGQVHDCVGIGLSFGGYELGYVWTTTVSPGGEISDETRTHYVVFAVPDDATGFYLRFMDLPEIYLGQ